MSGTTNPRPPAAPGSGADPAPPAQTSGAPGPDLPAQPEPPAPTPGPRRRRRGRALALAGVALAAGCAVGGAAVAAPALLRPHPPARPSHPLRGTVFTLRAGECADAAANGVSAARVIPCAQPHQAEIYGVFTAAGRRWPGGAALSRIARAGCASRLAGYLNPQLDTSALTQSYVYPDQGAWALGERKIICEVRAASGTLTGSVRALGGQPR